MSMVLCQGCRDLIDSDDDPECFTRHGNGPILCESCRPQMTRADYDAQQAEWAMDEERAVR